MKGILLVDSAGIEKNVRLEPSGNVIENSPVKILPSGRLRVPESKTISGFN